jgi:hypothetical protein
LLLCQFYILKLNLSFSYEYKYLYVHCFLLEGFIYKLIFPSISLFEIKPFSIKASSGII